MLTVAIPRVPTSPPDPNRHRASNGSIKSANRNTAENNNADQQEQTTAKTKNAIKEKQRPLDASDLLIETRLLGHVPTSEWPITRELPSSLSSVV
jgi:hypothetical protein